MVKFKVEEEVVFNMPDVPRYRERAGRVKAILDNDDLVIIFPANSMFASDMIVVSPMYEGLRQKPEVIDG